MGRFLTICLFGSFGRDQAHGVVFNEDPIYTIAL
jgi:hypothetical protein